RDRGAGEEGGHHHLQLEAHPPREGRFRHQPRLPARRARARVARPDRRTRAGDHRHGGVPLRPGDPRDGPRVAPPGHHAREGAREHRVAAEDRSEPEGDPPADRRRDPHRAPRARPAGNLPPLARRMKRRPRPRGHSMKKPMKKKTAARSAAKGTRARGKKAAPPLLASVAIARATARAQASVRTELSQKSRLAERMTEAALNEAEEIGMLLDEEDDPADEEPDSSGEENYFLKPQPAGPRHPRVRPAPGIETGVPPAAKSAKRRSVSAKTAPAKTAAAKGT